MRFVDDTELTVFLWRHLALDLDMRKLVLDTNERLTSRLEEIVHEDKSWRFNMGDIILYLEKQTPCVIQEDLVSNLRKCTYTVGKEREREFIDEHLGLTITVEEGTSLPENMEQAVLLLTSIVSMAVYPRDILSTAFLLSQLCPSVLPALKRQATSKKLNMTHSLISYVQKAVIDRNDGNDPVMKEHIVFLKRLLKAVEEIHDKFDEMRDPKKGIRAAFCTANKFLLICEPDGSSNLSPALKTIYEVVDEVAHNYHEIVQAAPNNTQIKPPYFNETERVCQSVVDRLTIMAPIPNVTSFSPKLRTPSVKTPTRATTSATVPAPSGPMTTPSVAAPISRLSTFINNQTPTPIRAPSLNTLTNLLEEEKENIDPNADALLLEVVKEKKSRFPTKPPKEKGLRVRKSFGNSNQAKRPPSQRSILSFFK